MNPSKSVPEASQLAQLKSMTRIVADTSDFEAMRTYRPEDATTNPSLILKAVQMDRYREILDAALAKWRDKPLSLLQRIQAISDEVLILFGIEILKIIPGRVSTETDARLSFDTDGIVRKSRQLIQLYEEQGIDRERVLIKIASTWEGIQAAKQLEKEKIRCNLTLLFSPVQAAACAEAEVQLISPFVGRIYDWYKKETGKEFVGSEDPGVQSVQEIYNYYKKFDYKTEVMGASFRNTGQILELAGCDLLTISPDLLQILSETEKPVERKLSPEHVKEKPLEKMSYDEKSFRYALNEDAMATEKTAEGIRNFAIDAATLERVIEQQL